MTTTPNSPFPKSSFPGPRHYRPGGEVERAVLHLDMDAFFAQVEQATNPALRGKPIAVVGSKKRTVVVTSSYEARKYGVKTAMTVGEVKRLCPHIIFVPGNNRKYIDTSVRIINILREFSPEVEVYSIDEAFVDITGSLRLFGGAEAIARDMKARIWDEVGLTASIGVAPNKLVAKIASDLKKPDGLVILTAAEVPGLMETLPIEEVCGIGRRTAAKLHSLGVSTCGELGRYPLSVLKKKFGVIGEYLHCMGKGLDSSPVIPVGKEDDIKSIGHSMTFPYDVEDTDGLHRYLLVLSAKVGRRARRAGCAGRTVALYVRFADFTGVGRRTTCHHHIQLDADIFETAAEILASIELLQPVRLLGVSLSNLTHTGRQLPLLTGERREFLLAHAMDSIRDTFGDDAVAYASVSDRISEAGVISPAWRPAGPRRVDPR